ncbi:hypothetical protein ACFC1R_00565 [Kitasatospora sp. NPDC056138]|uniref:hypothetical protein n=1 Tax=Kitasatospora sp. NPDC056138 TaxID=3345724 RepID=UPI0035DD9B2C
MELPRRRRDRGQPSVCRRPGRSRADAGQPPHRPEPPRPLPAGFFGVSSAARRVVAAAGPAPHRDPRPAPRPVPPLPDLRAAYHAHEERPAGLPPELARRRGRLAEVRDDLAERSSDTFCLNDGRQDAVLAVEQDRRVVGFLRAYFPVPGPLRSSRGRTEALPALQ